jgi:hypothetical protein
VQNCAFHAGHEFHHACFADVLDEAVNDVVAQIAVGHLPPAEAQAGLDLVAAGKKLDCLIFLGLVVMFIHGDGELDLLDHDDLLLFASRAFALFLLVEEPPIVLNAANRRNCVGRDFYQVEAALTGDFQCLEGSKNAKLFAVFVDDADFARTNSIVDADKGLCRTFIECDGTPPDVVSARFRKSPGLGAVTGTHPEYSIGPVRLNKGFMAISRLGTDGNWPGHCGPYFPSTSRIAVPDLGTAAW